jgi:hypothetical protein
MRTLKVDSTMVGQRVAAAADTTGTRTDPDGAILNIPIPLNTSLLLVSAPTYLEVADNPEADSAVVEVSLLEDPTTTLHVTRGVIVLRAEILLTAYL